MSDGAMKESLKQAKAFLAAVGFDSERCNERSALVFLALLGAAPGEAWDNAPGPTLRTVEIMAAIREQWDVNYAANTRETIRRQTLHQFADALFVEQNPDDPQRPVNSPKWCYRLRPQALELARQWGNDDAAKRVANYVKDRPGLAAMYAAERDMARIPLTLPDGARLTLSPGGQNVLLKEMVEEFCERFLPGGEVLYIGDADSKWAVFEKDRLAELGVTVDEHGKMPDLVVYLPDRKWLVLLEAASSHGPVDAKRHRELAALFEDSTVGLVYVSCFPSRAEMRKFLTTIAWETEVWCAEDPTHLIHFNGERFLGPY